MWLTRLAFWYLPNPRFTRCLGGFGPNLDPSSIQVSWILKAKTCSSNRGYFRIGWTSRQPRSSRHGANEGWFVPSQDGSRSIWIVV